MKKIKDLIDYTNLVWDLKYPKTHEITLNGVQIINLINYNGKLFCKYEGLFFNPIINPKNIKLIIYNSSLGKSEVKIVISLLKDTFIHFLCEDIIDPTIYEFKLIYDQS